MCFCHVFVYKRVLLMEQKDPYFLRIAINKYYRVRFGVMVGLVIEPVPEGLVPVVSVGG